MKALSLYSGGCDGMALAASRVGIETIAFCESDPACRAVLAARHPGKPIFLSDEDVTSDAIRKAGIDPGEIDIIMGGPPCQCASVAGKMLGDGDPRNRWPQFLRIVREIRPRWMLAENSPNVRNVNGGRLFGTILGEMAQSGYDAQWACWGASDVGAPHKRERIFILGYTERSGRGGQSRRRTGQELEDGYLGGIARTGSMENTIGLRCERQGIPCKQQRGADVVGASENGGMAYASSEGLQIGGCRSSEQGAAQSERHGSLGDVGDSYSQRQQAGVREGDHREQNAQTRDGGSPVARTSHGAASEGPCLEPGLGRDFAGVLTGMDDVAVFLESWPWPAPRRKEGPSPQYGWEPPRVAAGIPNRAARIKMIGNSCPPQQYMAVLGAVAEVNRAFEGG